MCKTPDVEPAAPTPAPPAVLKQIAPKKAASAADTDTKKKGLSRYKINAGSASSATSSSLGGIPTKTGV